MSKLTVTYIKHSGFLIETANSYLLFDYWQGKLPELQYDKELYIFSSHAHHDHYTKDIFKLENKCQRVVYVLSSDIKRASSFWKKAENVIFMKPHEEKEIDDCVISTLKSTDEGVAFLVKTEGKTIYHAGDLHWWDWPGEPEEDNKMMEQLYKAEMADYEYYCAGTAVCSGLSIYHNTNRGIHGVNPLMLSTEVLLNENQTRRGWETSSVGGGECHDKIV